jgi:hypothetical protein
MVGLTAEANSLESSQMSSQSSPCKCKSEPAQGSANTSPLHPLLYVRYKDHVIYKNLIQPNPEAIERETVGWLAHENQDIILIEHDRTIKRKDISSGKSNGIIILKSCILEALPLQKNSEWQLNCQQPIAKDEYAFRPSERKTQRAKKLQRRKLD